MTRLIRKTVVQIEDLRDDAIKGEGIYRGTDTQKLVNICSNAIKQINNWVDNNQDKSEIMQWRENNTPSTPKEKLKKKQIKELLSKYGTVKLKIYTIVYLKFLNEYQVSDDSSNIVKIFNDIDEAINFFLEALRIEE